MLSHSLGLTRARLWTAAGPSAREVDLWCEDGRIAGIGPVGSAARAGAEVVDLEGRWVMPGLVDHHVHFTLWAEHCGRLDLSSARSAQEAVAQVREAMALTPPTSRDDAAPVVGRSFQDALWPDLPTAVALDDAVSAAGQPQRPVILISHDLHSAWINTAAASRLGVRAGLLREDEAFAVEMALEDLERAAPHQAEQRITNSVRRANSRGVTGIMDLEMADNAAMWAARVANGVRGLRVRAGVYPRHLEAAVARGERTGKRLPGTHGLVSVGPLKLFADGTLNTRTAWCDEPYPHTEDYGHAAHARGDLERLMADARNLGFDVALHAIGDRAVAEGLDAFEATGARGAIEHAQLVRDADVERFARLGVGAGIHPEHALDDRDVADALWSGRTGRAFAFGAMARAGVRLWMGSDAPVAPLDPWVSISAAVHRTRDSAPAWEPDNALSVRHALAATWAMPQVSEGALGDLVAIDADPRDLSAQALREMPVAATVVAGEMVYSAL